MLFYLLKGYARLAIRIYCRHIYMNKPQMRHIRGPVLFAANHPNSFLDGIILTTLMEDPLYSLARGDAFRNRKHNRILRWLRLLPVYRTSEGVENLAHNYTTFAACQEAFRRNRLVMIFSEGGCRNEWHLRPLRKGTARLALSSWLQDIDLTVIPVGFNYSPFRNFGKNVFIHFGHPLDRQQILNQESEGKQLLAFNDQLRKQLEGLVYEIDPSDRQQLKEMLYVPQSRVKRVLLALPAGLGWALHAPLYYPFKAFARSFESEHFDAVMAGGLMVVYPFYLLLLYAIGAWLTGWLTALSIFLLLPFCAWACVQLKNQLD